MFEPQVKLVNTFDNPYDNSVATARTCYSGKGIVTAEQVRGGLLEGEKKEKALQKRDALAQSIFKAGHHTTLQHAHFQFALSGISRQFTWSFLHSHPYYNCVSGDTIIPNFNQGDKKPYTIAELCAANPNRRKLMRIRSVNDEGTLVPNQIKNVVYSGQKEVFRVKTLMGYEIKATAKHRFMREDGSWARLGKLKIGDRILVNGVVAYKDEAWLRQKYHKENLSQAAIAELAGCSTHTVRKWVRVFELQKPMGSWSKGVAPPQKGRTKEDYEPLQRSSETMKRIGHKPPRNGRAEKNSNWKGDECKSPRDRTKLWYKAEKCAVCGRTKGQTKRLERHHRDGNIYNNSPENVLILCALCHKAAESPHRTIKRVTPDIIESIELVGVEDTYDIEMEAPFHNFVGNGFILHNSEQASQRYITVNPENIVIPPLAKDAQIEHYRKTVAMLMEAYQKLTELLIPAVRIAYEDRFPARAGTKQADYDIQKKAIEVARYVLPVGTMTHMYHTISALVLLRYWRICQSVWDTPTEAKIVVGKMIEAVCEHDPDFAKVVAEPKDVHPTMSTTTDNESKWHRGAFDREMLSYQHSRLVAWTYDGHRGDPDMVLARAVAQARGVYHSIAPEEPISDKALGRFVEQAMLTPPDALNLDLHDTIGRALQAVSFTFYHRISHTADSQDQRHRTTPGARPSLVASFPYTPDYITPRLIEEQPEAQELYIETMANLWKEIEEALRLGYSREYAAYLLPNATVIRYTEQGDLAGIKHKMRMRLCYNAQEEIFRMACEEAAQITNVAPLIGQHLIPPCRARSLADVTPKCPEGERFCGVKVWDVAPENVPELVGKRGVL